MSGFSIHTVRPILLGILGLLIAVGAWEASSAVVGNPGLLPPSSRITAAARAWFESGSLYADVLQSVPRAWSSLLIALPLGLSLGLLLAISSAGRQLFDWQLQFFRSLPPVALLPLFIVWFGIGWQAKLLASVLVCTFPILVTTVQGASLLDRQYKELAVDFGLSRTRYVLRVLLPGVLPALAPGLRLAAGTAFVMIYVSELAGASSGLGYRISIAQLAFQADLMIAALGVLGAFALATDVAIRLLTNKLVHYAGKQ